MDLIAELTQANAEILEYWMRQQVSLYCDAMAFYIEHYII
jgi:hypothetical protein